MSYGEDYSTNYQSQMIFKHYLLVLVYQDDIWDMLIDNMKEYSCVQSIVNISLQIVHYCFVDLIYRR